MLRTHLLLKSLIVIFALLVVGGLIAVFKFQTRFLSLLGAKKFDLGEECLSAQNNKSVTTTLYQCPNGDVVSLRKANMVGLMDADGEAVFDQNGYLLSVSNPEVTFKPSILNIIRIITRQKIGCDQKDSKPFCVN